jgi:cation transport ATPase
MGKSAKSSKSSKSAPAKPAGTPAPAKSPAAKQAPAKQAPAKQAPAKQPPKRSTLLTIALVLVVLYGIVMAAVYWTVLPDVQRTATNVVLWIVLLAAVAIVVAGIAMWYWKAWGIYLFAGAAAVTSIATVLVSGDFFLLFGAILPAILVLYVILRERSKFA